MPDALRALRERAAGKTKEYLEGLDRRGRVRLALGGLLLFLLLDAWVIARSFGGGAGTEIRHIRGVDAPLPAEASPGVPGGLPEGTEEALAAAPDTVAGAPRHLPGNDVKP